MKKINVILGSHNCNYVCRKCLNSYTNQDVLVNHIQKCGQQEMTPINLGNESHLYRKKHFHTNPLYFSIDADSEAKIENDFSNIGNKTFNFSSKTQYVTDII